MFSIAKYIGTDHRRTLTHQLLEAIMFLRYDERLWNDILISQAVNIANSELSTSRLVAHLAQEEPNEELED